MVVYMEPRGSWLTATRGGGGARVTLNSSKCSHYLVLLNRFEKTVRGLRVDCYMDPKNRMMQGRSLVFGSLQSCA